MWKRLIWTLSLVTTTVTAQVNADAPHFTDDEIAIYRDFLVHYPEHPSELIGMQDKTVAFEAAYAFGDEPNPPNVEVPKYSGRKLPPEIMALADEKAVAGRLAAEGNATNLALTWRTHLKLSEIAFDSNHEKAVFIYSSLQNKGGSRGTVVYELKGGQWKRTKILNYWNG
jgi:hypothetical protein